MVSASQREAERRAERIDRKAAAESSSALAKAAMGLGAAFLVYQRYGQRWLREQVATSPQPITRRRLVELANRLGAEGIDKFVLTAVPSLISGYANGLKEAKEAQRNPAWIEKTAEHYANRLGEHIHNVSAEALIDGFTAQLNRRVPARVAVDRVIDAFGVAPKTMKALVNVWLGPAPKESPTSLPLGNPIKERADRIIADAIASRANAVGETEAYTSKNQAKSVIWNWRHQKGELPDTARVVWYTAKDERVCPVCAPMHGKTRKVNERFRLPTGEQVWAPQVHPHCRCDVVLVMSVNRATLDMSLRQAQMLDEAREFVSVAKQSRWEQENRPKRDAGGRFARVEGRQRSPQSQPQRRRPQVKDREQMDPGVAEVMRQTRQFQQQPQQPRLRQQERPRLTQSPRLRPTVRLREQARLRPPAEEVRLRQPQAPSATEARLQGPRLQTPRLNQQSARLAPPEIKLVPLEQVNLHKPDMAQGNDKWVNTPENRPLYAVFDDLLHRNGHDGFIADESVGFYDSHGDPLALEKALDDYWSEVYDRLPDVFASDSFFNSQNHLLEYTDRDGTTYYIDYGMYADVFFWAMNGGKEDEVVWIPVRRPGSAREMNIMDTSADLAEEPVSAQFLATRLGIDEFIEGLTPTVGVAYHINMHEQGVTGTGAMTNPGKWRIVGGDTTTWMSDEHGQHYNLVYIEPEDL